MSGVQTLLPIKLDAKNSDFAFRTIKERMPVILVKTIDDLSKNMQKCSNKKLQYTDVKLVIQGLSKLRYELMTDKPLVTLEYESTNLDIDKWNDAISGLDEAAQTWFSAPWLFVECYMYRRVMNVVCQSALDHLDPFRMRKLSGFLSSLDNIAAMLSCIKQTTSTNSQHVADDLKFFLMSSLWSNEFDLSMNVGSPITNDTSDAAHLRQQILLKRSYFMAVDEIDSIVANWLASSSSSCIRVNPRGVAIVMDNTGREMVSDFILGEFLITSGLASHVDFFPKLIPWFVSDVTLKDIDWLLDEGSQLHASRVPTSCFPDLAAKWKSRLREGSFSIRSDQFWTLPFGYCDMQQLAPELFNRLTSGYSVVIFKGDLHYRKLLEDRKWVTTSTADKKRAFERSFQTEECGDHSVLVALRVAKSDVAVGLSESRHAELCKDDPHWLTKGKYGFAQVISPTSLYDV